MATSTALVSQSLDVVRLADVELPARLLLFSADTPSRLVLRAYDAGLRPSDLLLVCAPRPA